MIDGVIAIAAAKHSGDIDLARQLLAVEGQRLAEQLRQGKYRRGGLSILQALRRIDREALSTLAVRAGAPVVCREGCAACCHQSVVCHPGEVLLIAAHLRQRLRPAQIAALVSRLRDPRDTPSCGPVRTRAACPLLGPDRRCTVYSVRPLKCAGENSMDAVACASDEGEHACVIEQFQAADLLVVVLMHASQLLHLDPGPVDLCEALAIALTEPNAEARWRAGADVFAPARQQIVVTPSRPLSQEESRRYLPVVTP